MTKYIVTVYFKNGNNQILTVKAKSDSALDIKIAKELKAIFGNLDDINYIEYDKVKRYMFTKKVYWQVPVTMVGCGILKELLNKEGTWND